MTDFKMPSLGADMERGTVVAWNVKTGDKVQRGDIVCEVETQKGNIEVEIWQDGIIQQICVDQGEEVPVGTTLATVAAEGEGNEQQAQAQPPAPPQMPPTPDKEQPVPASNTVIPQAPVTLRHEAPTKSLHLGVSRHKRLWVSPLARRIAADKSIPLAQVHGTGAHGEITKRDVLAYEKEHLGKPAAPVTTAASTVDSPAAKRNKAMRQAIAAAMSKSKREIPHYYLQTEIDMGPALEILDQKNGSRPLTERLLPAALYIKVVAEACHKVPEMNVFWIDGECHPTAAVHVGMGISLRKGGLVAPAIHDADQKPVTTIMADLLDLVARARSGKLKSSEISDATITVTNLGDQGVETVFGVIYPPQVALVGLGKVTQRPFTKDGMLGVHPVLTATLAGDHRASDGHRGGLFLGHIRRLLLNPTELEF